MGRVRGAAIAEDARGTSTQSHIPPSILEYEDYLYMITTFMYASEARNLYVRPGVLDISKLWMSTSSVYDPG